MSFWATHKPYLKDVDSTQHTRKPSPCEPLECRLRQGSRTHCTVPYRNSIVNYYSICCLSITYSSPFCVLLIDSFWGAKNEQKYATGRYIFKWNCTGANLSTKSFKNRTFTRPDKWQLPELQYSEMLLCSSPKAMQLFVGEMSNESAIPPPVSSWKIRVKIASVSYRMFVAGFRTKNK